MTGWSTSCASACKSNTTQNQPHQISNTQRTENKTTDVVIQQHSRKLLMMDILMSETCWAHKKWNKITSDTKLVFHSSTITMMHSPISTRFTKLSFINIYFYVIMCLKSTSKTRNKLQGLPSYAPRYGILPTLYSLLWKNYSPNARGFG